MPVKPLHYTETKQLEELIDDMTKPGNQGQLYKYKLTHTDSYLNYWQISHFNISNIDLFFGNSISKKKLCDWENNEHPLCIYCYPSHIYIMKSNKQPLFTKENAGL